MCVSEDLHKKSYDRVGKEIVDKRERIAKSERESEYSKSGVDKTSAQKKLLEEDVSLRAQKKIATSSTPVGNEAKDQDVITAAKYTPRNQNKKKIDLSKDDDSPGVAQWRRQRKHDAQAERQKQRKEQRFKKKTKPTTNFPRNETREKDQKKKHVEAKAKENNRKNASMDNNVIKLFAQLLERAAVTHTTTPLGA